MLGKVNYDRLMIAPIDVKYRDGVIAHELKFCADLMAEKVSQSIQLKIYRLFSRYGQLLGELSIAREKPGDDMYYRFHPIDELEVKYVERPFNEQEIWMPQENKRISMSSLETYQGPSERAFNKPVRVIPWRKEGDFKTGIVVIKNEILGKLIELYDKDDNSLQHRDFIPLSSVVFKYI